MYQRIELIGRLGKAPEVKTFDGGKKKASFSVATSETRKNKAAEKVEETEWHNVTAWNSLAEICEKLLTKGSLVFVEGKVKTRSWDTSTGEKKYITEVVADRVQVLGAGKQKTQQPATSGEAYDDIPWS